MSQLPTREELLAEGDSWKEELEPGNGSRRRIDPELRAMDSILRTIEELSPFAQERVLLWLAHRVGFPAAAADVRKLLGVESAT